MIVTPHAVPDFDFDDKNGDNNSACDSLDFQPRLQADLDSPLPFLGDVISPSSKSSASGNGSSALKVNNGLNARTRPTSTNTAAPETCFEKVRLVSPEYFAAAERKENMNTAAGTTGNLRDRFFELQLNTDTANANAVGGGGDENCSNRSNMNMSSPLANMVHPMNLDLFIAETSPEKKHRKQKQAAIAAAAATSSTTRTKKSQQHQHHHHHQQVDYCNDNDNSNVESHNVPDDASSALSAITMTSRTSHLSVSSAPVAQGSSRRTGFSSMFRMDRYRQGGKNPKTATAGSSSAAGSATGGSIANESQRSQSSFLSSSTTGSRISYSLRSGRRGMSREEKRQARLLLRQQSLDRDKASAQNQHEYEQDHHHHDDSNKKQEEESAHKVTVKNVKRGVSFKDNVKRAAEEKKEEVESSPPMDIPCFIYVLLVEPAQKIFEVVKIDPATAAETIGAPKGSSTTRTFSDGLTVGDILAQARTGATDPALATQRYVSLCNATQELAAPMLPVDLLSRQSPSSGDKKKGFFSDKKKKKKQIPEMLMAVPEGSTADVVRQIHSRLMQNPRMQRWWKQQDPFDSSPSKKKKESKRSPSKHRSSRGRTSTPVASPTEQKRTVVV